MRNLKEKKKKRKEKENKAIRSTAAPLALHLRDKGFSSGPVLTYSKKGKTP